MSSKQDISNSFTKEEGVIHLGGIDALVRLTLDQIRTDARRGLKTGMFVSGYRGSPVGMLDAALLDLAEKLRPKGTITVGATGDREVVGGIPATWIKMQLNARGHGDCPCKAMAEALKGDA